MKAIDNNNSFVSSIQIHSLADEKKKYGIVYKKSGCSFKSGLLFTDMIIRSFSLRGGIDIVN